MARMFIAVAMLYSAAAVFAEAPPRTHIEQLIPTERCVYAAKLAAAGSWLRIHKHATSCDTIKYLWHNDETDFEIAFVREHTCFGFQLGKDPITAGDTAYMNCIKQIQ